MFGFNELGQGSIQTEVSAEDPNNENFCAYGAGRKCLAALWQRGAMIALPTLGGNNSTVGNINAGGEIAGIAETGVRDQQCSSMVSFGGTGPQALDFEAVIWVLNPARYGNCVHCPETQWEWRYGLTITARLSAARALVQTRGFRR